MEMHGLTEDSLSSVGWSTGWFVGSVKSNLSLKV